MRYLFEKKKNDAQDWMARADSRLKTYLLWIIAICVLQIVTGLIFSNLMSVWPGTKYVSWLVYDVSIIAGIYFAIRTGNIIALITAGGLKDGMPEIRIGNLLTAPFTKEKWPDFKLKDFLNAGGSMTVLVILYAAYIPIGLGLFEVVTTQFVAWNPWAIVSVIGVLLMLAFIEIKRKGKAVLFIRGAYAVALMQVVIGSYETFHHFSKTEIAAKKAVATSERHLDNKFSRQVAEVEANLNANSEKTLSPEEEQALKWRSEATGGLNIGDRVGTVLSGDTKAQTIILRSFDKTTYMGLRPRRKYKVVVEKEYQVLVLDPKKNIQDINVLNGHIAVNGAGNGQCFWANDDGSFEISWPLLEKMSLVSPTSFVLTLELQRFD